MTPLSRLRSALGRWLAKAKPFWFFPASFMLADLLLAGIVISLGSLFWLERAVDPGLLSAIAAAIVACHAFTRVYASRKPLGPAVLAVRIILGNLLAVALYAAARDELPHLLMSRTTFAAMMAGFAVLQGGLHLWHRRAARVAAGPTLEPLRWMLLASLLLALHKPLLTTGSVGAGDAYWYSIMVADFVSQWRAHVFPVFAGQSEFAFNGAISPLRVAPALQHMAGVVDLLTWHSLPFYGILNLTLAGAFLGGAFTCYGSLRAIKSDTPWLALMLSLLFSACPAVLALAYVGDLFMSITTLPFVPLVLYGAWRTLTKGDLAGVLVMVAAAGALWYCHPPIALWATLVAAVTQIVKFIRDGRNPRTWLNWLIGAACFGVLTLYCFVSVKTLGLPAAATNRLVLIANLQSAFPAAFQPISPGVNELGDYQLGWSLWGVLSIGLIGLIFNRSRRAASALLCAMLVLLAFLLPTPWLLRKLWLSMPQVICDITFMWPMQRLYVLLAGLTVFFTYVTVGPLIVRHRWRGTLVLALFLGGLGWSSVETVKFHRHALLSTTLPGPAHQQHLPQNHILTRYSFNPFQDIPSYYSHGFVDPQMQNRLLAASTLAELTSNIAVMDHNSNFGLTRGEGPLTGSRPRGGPTLALEPSLHLEPRHRYALKIDFTHPELKGALTLRGERMNRLYWLPDSGYDIKTATPSRAFAALPGRPHTITVWTDGAKAEDVGLQFYFLGDAPMDDFADFGHYTLKEYDPNQLPITVTDWSPYRASVKAPAAAYLETPRLFLAGYHARVNGHKVPVTRSPDALVMIPVPAGDSVVELSYDGPLSLRCAYFFSLTGWALLLLWAIRSRWRARHAPSSA